MTNGKRRVRHTSVKQRQEERKREGGKDIISSGGKNGEVVFHDLQNTLLGPKIDSVDF